MNAMKYVAITLNFYFFRGRGVNQDKRQRMVVLVPKFLSLNYSVKLGLEKKKKKRIAVSFEWTFILCFYTLYFGFRFNVNKIFNKLLSEGPFSCFSSI